MRNAELASIWAESARRHRSLASQRVVFQPLDQVRGQERGVGNQCVFDTFVNCFYNKGFFENNRELYMFE